MYPYKSNNDIPPQGSIKNYVPLNKNSKRKGKTMIEKLRKVWFILTGAMVLIQTLIGFYALKADATTTGFKSVISVLFAIYLVAFVVLVVMGLGSKKHSTNALKAYKRSQNIVKRLLTISLLLFNVLVLIKSGAGLKIASAAAIVFNVLLIVIDIKMAELAAKIERKRKKREKIKQERKQMQEQPRNNNVSSENTAIDNKNYNKHKRGWFFGDFSKKINKKDENTTNIKEEDNE